MGDVGDEEKGTNDPIQVKIFGRTDVGLVREHNEDNFLVADLEHGNRSLLPEVRTHNVGKMGSLLAVCDGMGGAAAGEVASQIAVDTVYDLMQLDDPPKGEEGLALRLEKAILDAGKKIFQSAKADRTRRGMGTTITAGALISNRIIFGQVGDSRAYLIRKNRLTQVTRDQSLVNQLIEAGQLKPEEADLFEHSNIILQALGTAEDVTVDLTYVDLRKGDLVLLCSDGLSGLVTDERIRQLTLENPVPIKACKALTEAAREGGGHDNITVIVAEFDGEGLKAATDDEVVEFQRLELPGRTPLPTRQPPVAAPDWAAPADDGGRPSSSSTPPSDAGDSSSTKASSAEPARKQSGGSSWIMWAAVVLVLAVGVGLGFWIVKNSIEDENTVPPPRDDGAVATETVDAVTKCRFTADAPGTRLIIDGQDYEDVGPDGRVIELTAGTYSVIARRGEQVIEEREIEVPEGQEELVIPPFITPEEVVDAGPAVAADASIADDGGPKPPDADPRDIEDVEPPLEDVVDPTDPTATPADGGGIPRLDPSQVTERPEPRPRPRPRPRPQPERPVDINSTPSNPYD